MNNDILKRDINLLKGSIDPYESNLTNFNSVSEIYTWTNENFSLYPKLDLNGKNVLTVTASGDHALNLILQGATKIDSFDINVFAKYYSSLKHEMLKKYDYDSFFNIMQCIVKSLLLEKKLGSEILNEISSYDTNNYLMLWHYLEEKNLCLDVPLSCMTKSYLCPCYDEDDFYKVKENIKNAKITYYDADILELSNVLKNKKYDLIYLSNILGRIIKPSFSKRFYSSLFLLKKLYELLNDNGMICCYDFSDDKFYYDLKSELSCLYDAYQIREKHTKSPDVLWSFTKKT